MNNYFFQMCTVLEALATNFAEFHASGLQQYQCSKSIAEGLQKLSGLFQGSSKTLSEPLNQVYVCVRTES